MGMTTCTKWMLRLLITSISFCQFAGAQEPELSKAEKTIVDLQVAMLRSAEERQTVEGWSNAKKVAEMICAPAALSILKKQSKGVDKVFLGTDAADSLSLETNQDLTGSGQYRTPNGWQDFTFTCELNADTGKVTSFKTTGVAAANTGPKDR